MDKNRKPDLPPANPDDETLRRLLRECHTVAVVGLSENPERDSHRVAAYLQNNGYRVVPVNPGAERILGERAYAHLRAVPFPVDLVDIFRKTAAIPEIVDAAIAVGARAVWMQLGLLHPQAAGKASAAGLSVVQDRCVKIEHHRLAPGVMPT